ncbi:hypothetical protein F3K34_33640 [Streptomyces sp. LBUM 1486]|uniref:hypothetical protein n=1 Tax=Streptomyces scabiei TaxID=1930 RepID=UPI001B3289F4|nr:MULTISPECIES: hypothetical protein [unclassified Streptomyces]MBP5883476.1 hypothetical protein [Streptomyces sp. LBUM 1487]MBP5916907.1 hypothetical protein [Streptomyces sp. LBUM 1486]
MLVLLPAVLVVVLVVVGGRAFLVVGPRHGGVFGHVSCGGDGGGGQTGCHYQRERGEGADLGDPVASQRAYQ